MATNELTMYLARMTTMVRELSPSTFNYCGIEDYVLDRGTDQEVSEPLTTEELEFVQYLVGMLGPFKMKQCFYNAQLTAIQNPEFQYMEGFAQGRAGLPCHHGWLTLDGKLVDLTWRTDSGVGVLGVLPEGWRYRGVTFETEHLLERWLDTGEARAVIGDWTRGFPCFQQSRVGAP